MSVARSRILLALIIIVGVLCAGFIGTAVGRASYLPEVNKNQIDYTEAEVIRLEREKQELVERFERTIDALEDEIGRIWVYVHLLEALVPAAPGELSEAVAQLAELTGAPPATTAPPETTTTTGG